MSSKTRAFLFFIVGVVSSVSLMGQNVLSPWECTSFLDKLISAPLKFKPIPQADDTYWRTQIPLSIRKDYISLGEKYLGAHWTPISNSLFSEFTEKGNRSNYERKNFLLRRQLACLVLAEIMEYKGRFINDIVKGLHYFISEVWWGIPAHYPHSIPDTQIQTVDLFNAESASLIAWATYMLKSEIDKVDNAICDQMNAEINRRFLLPARTENYWWKTSKSNWNPWICSNWLTCILFCEKNRSNQIEAIKQVIRCMNVYYSSYPSDGGCDEGIYYWIWGPASFYICLEMLNRASKGLIALYDDNKLKAMGQYVTNSYIGNQYFISFADSKTKMLFSPHITIPFGHYTKDSALMQYGAYVAQQRSYTKKPSSLFLSSGNFPVLGRELLFLSNYSTNNEIAPTEPYNRDVFFQDLQICIARSYEGRGDGLYVASKGGNNAENHNHNDVGNFIIYADGKPVIIDLGAGTYTAQTFGKNRYELFNCRSAYHNVPIVNGFEQKNGKEYKATNVTYKQTDNYSIFSLNIEGAYPQEANIVGWERTIRLNRGRNVIVTENYRLQRYVGRSQIVLVCLGNPSYIGNGIIQIVDDNTKHYIKFSTKHFSPTIEKIKNDDPSIQEDWNKKDLFRVILTIKDKKLKGKVKYEIF